MEAFDEKLLRAATLLVQKKISKGESKELDFLFNEITTLPAGLQQLWELYSDTVALEESFKDRDKASLFSIIIEPIQEAFRLSSETCGLILTGQTASPAFRSGNLENTLSKCTAIRIVEEPFQAIIQLNVNFDSRGLTLSFIKKYASQELQRMELMMPDGTLESIEFIDDECTAQLEPAMNGKLICMACTSDKKAEVTGFLLNKKPA